VHPPSALEAATTTALFTPSASLGPACGRAGAAVEGEEEARDEDANGDEFQGVQDLEKVVVVMRVALLGTTMGRVWSTMVGCCSRALWSIRTLRSIRSSWSVWTLWSVWARWFVVTRRTRRTVRTIMRLSMVGRSIVRPSMVGRTIMRLSMVGGTIVRPSMVGRTIMRISMVGRTTARPSMVGTIMRLPMGRTAMWRMARGEMAEGDVMWSPSRQVWVSMVPMGMISMTMMFMGVVPLSVPPLAVAVVAVMVMVMMMATMELRIDLMGCAAHLMMKGLEDALQAIAVSHANFRFGLPMPTDALLLLGNMILKLIKLLDHEVKLGNLVVQVWL
jgi:hypothetical protein